MEIIQLKMDVAKEREINACLRDEISSVKVNFKREIRLLQETIDIQNQVIDQLKVKNEMKDEVCDILETAQEEDSFEVDLSLEAEAWIIEAESFDATEDMEDAKEDHEDLDEELDEDESTEAEEEASFIIAKENFFEDHEESLHDSLLDTSESFSDYESSVQTSNSSISTPKISKAPKKILKTPKTSSNQSYEDEGYKIIIELSKEIDALKTSLTSSEEDLLVYKVSFEANYFVGQYLYSLYFFTEDYSPTKCHKLCKNEILIKSFRIKLPSLKLILKPRNVTNTNSLLIAKHFLIIATILVAIFLISNLKMSAN